MSPERGPSYEPSDDVEHTESVETEDPQLTELRTAYIGAMRELLDEHPELATAGPEELSAFSERTLPTLIPLHERIEEVGRAMFRDAESDIWIAHQRTCAYKEAGLMGMINGPIEEAQTILAHSPPEKREEWLARYR